jgi:H+-transporting ATPase
MEKNYQKKILIKKKDDNEEVYKSVEDIEQKITETGGVKEPKINLDEPQHHVKDLPEPSNENEKKDQEKKTHVIELDDKDDKGKPKNNIDEILKKLETTRDGLTEDEAKSRLDKFGPNALPEKKPNNILKFFSFMWNPLSWAMEIAAIIAISLIDYVDFILIVALLFINASIGFWEEHSSGNAIAALKAQLSPKTKCIRDGQVKKDTLSATLVPGDVVLLRLGDIIPADCILLEGEGLKIDQSSLTGESLPVSRYAGDEIFSGSIVKMGETKAVVHATGVHTFFGKAANLVQNSEKSGHFQTVLKAIGYFCISVIIVWVVIELIVQFGIRHNECVGVTGCGSLNNMLVLIVGGVPIAMPTVLSVTMAIGAGQLAKKKAIVSRLTAVEEMAGMDILCSDKTGTLTKNKLSVAEPIPVGGHNPDNILLEAALASKPENEDAIDIAIVQHCSEAQQNLRKKYKLLHYKPFDPISKKTVAKLEAPDGTVFHTAKGAPQVILKESINKERIEERVNEIIMKLAKRGYRSLGVATSDAEGKLWIMTGILPLFDPPRDDTAKTIKKTKNLGIKVKMITGDQLAIAKETARMLGMGQDILPANRLKESTHEDVAMDELILNADGFAEVFPEHKYEIVKRLQAMGHVLGMTGDGVNDAPALKKADIGIAVADATDAARAAADIVLTCPGLSVIIDAVVGSRKIFQRMRNYCMYSIASTVRIVLTFGILTVAYDFYFPVIATVILAIFNDGSMMTISKDRVKPNQKPDKWRLSEIFITAISLGTWNTISTIVMFILARSDFFYDHFGLEPFSNTNEGNCKLRAFIYTQVSISALATIFVTRSHSWSWRERPGYFVITAFVCAQLAASLLGAYGLSSACDFPTHAPWGPAGWGYVGIAWLWCLVWYIPLDLIKFAIRWGIEGKPFRFFHDDVNSESGVLGKKQPLPPGYFTIEDVLSLVSKQEREQLVMKLSEKYSQSSPK